MGRDAQGATSPMMKHTDAVKYPWMKFYPADWRADTALRMCSLAARGLWMEMLSIMHEATPRGSLLINGKNIGSKQLANLCGATLRETAALLTELETAGVFSRADDGTIFSRRMKRDVEKAERDKANGKTGGNPNLNAGVTPGIKPRSQRPKVRNQKPRLQKERRERTRTSALAAPWTEADRERFWEAYPNKVGKGEAMNAFDKNRPFCNPAMAQPGALARSASDKRAWPKTLQHTA